MKHILFLGIGVIAACTQHSVTTNNSKAGPTQVFLIDAPFPYDQVARVDVYIVRVAAGPSAVPGVGAGPGGDAHAVDVDSGHLVAWARTHEQAHPRPSRSAVL